MTEVGDKVVPDIYQSRGPKNERNPQTIANDMQISNDRRSRSKSYELAITNVVII